ncbi:MAG: response regulator [Aggregatilineales bacterium]
MVRILYVEDNPGNMDLVCRILRHVGGYEVSGAINGLSGVQMALDEEPDLILMDINLPDIDGLEVTRRIKANPDFNGTPIVAFTASTSEADRERFLEAGCDGYITKPANAKILLETVKEYF